MFYYLIAYTAWACPWWAPKSIPKQLICQEKREIAVVYDFTSAVEKIREVGQGAALWQLHGTFLRPIKIKWRTELEIVEEL